MRRSRGLAALGAIALTVTGLLATAAPASAHDSGGSRVSVTLKGDGSTAWVSNDEVRAGAVRLTVTGSSSAGAEVVVVGLQHGATIAHFLHDLGIVVMGSNPPAKVAQTMRDIERIAVAYGGGDTLPGRSVSDTIVLPRHGAYYITNVTPNGKAVSLGRLQVRGHTDEVRVPDYSATVTLGQGSHDVITVSRSLAERGTIRVRNHSDMIHLLQITPVAKGVTDAKVQAEYDQIVAGKKPTSDPAGLNASPSRLVGSDAISPGHAAYLTYSLPAGTYLLQCFVPDTTTGLPHAFMGMHKVVVIR
jgi:hypothetical protein